MIVCARGRSRTSTYCLSKFLSLIVTLLLGCVLVSVIPNASWFFKRPKVALDKLSVHVDGYSTALFERTQQVLDSFANSPPVAMPAFASAAGDTTVAFDWSNSRPPSPWWAENRPAQLRQRWAAAIDTQVLRSSADAIGGASSSDGGASSGISGSSGSSSRSGSSGVQIEGGTGIESSDSSSGSSGSSGSGGGGGNSNQGGEPVDGGEPPIPAAHVAQAKSALASAGVRWANEPRISALSAGFCNWVRSS